ncbi:MAG: tryptophan synthase subunit alpha [Dehalococcoidia bacterium]
MSERLRERFRTRDRQRPLFIPYVTAAYPAPSDTVDILLAMEAGGADVIEIGVPFSDPLADGATIQHANEVALAQGASFALCLEFVRDARERGLQAPVLFMGYYNPLLAYGEERAVRDAREAGADGFIVVDLPPDEAGTFLAACRDHDMSFVPLVSPTTSEARIAGIAATADAFLYCVSVTGTTGARAELPPGLGEFIERVRKHTDLPLAIGFGISTREHVEQAGRLADAVVVGSAIISTIDAADGNRRAQGVREYVERVTGRRDTGGGDGPA